MNNGEGGPTGPHPLPLGRVVATPGAIDLLDRLGGPRSKLTIATLIRRHSNGDWGDLCDEDRQVNVDALANGERIMSVYTVHDARLYVITEADRSATTFLLPSEY
ncbi:MAG: hypothetical protein H0U69_03455 [Trueperaceae bacterium]|nr:hypothetical protein [Trueperaceae bacterium]